MTVYYTLGSIQKLAKKEQRLYDAAISIFEDPPRAGAACIWGVSQVLSRDDLADAKATLWKSEKGQG